MSFRGAKLMNKIETAKELRIKISVVAICLHLRQTERVCATDLVFALARMRDRKF
jgi:hypothetical protein